MKLVSGREFAREAGVSESMVRKAIESGRISRHASGKIDLDTQLTRFHGNRDDSKVRTPSKVRTAHPPEVRTRKEHPDNRTIDGEGVNGINGDINGSLDDDDEGLEDPEVGGSQHASDGALLRARIRKEEYLGKLRQLEYRKRRGELVERSVVEKVYFEFARQTRDAVLNFPSRLAAIQAAALLHYLRTALAGLLTDEQLAALDKHIGIEAVEKIVNETMASETRVVLDALASSKAPKLK